MMRILLTRAVHRIVHSIGLVPSFCSAGPDDDESIQNWKAREQEPRQDEKQFQCGEQPATDPSVATQPGHSQRSGWPMDRRSA